MKKMENTQINNENIDIVLTNEDWKNPKHIHIPIYILPQKNEIFQYNGIQYIINDVIHHYHNEFKPYIELKVTEMNEFFNFNSPIVGIDKKSYNKAINQFVERLMEAYKPCKEIDMDTYKNICKRFYEIAEDLKKDIEK